MAINSVEKRSSVSGIHPSMLPGVTPRALQGKGWRTVAGRGYYFSDLDIGLVANTGSFTLTGLDVRLLHDEILRAGTGTFLLEGSDVLLKHNKFIIAEPGTFNLTGSDITLYHGKGINQWAVLVEEEETIYLGLNDEEVITFDLSESPGQEEDIIHVNITQTIIIRTKERIDILL